MRKREKKEKREERRWREEGGRGSEEGGRRGADANAAFSAVGLRRQLFVWQRRREG